MFSLFKEKKMSDRNQEDQSGSESDKGAVSSQDSPDYKPYAGIGSRETPKTICKMMELIAFGLGRQGFTCRTGGADGADRAFLKGSNSFCLGLALTVSILLFLFLRRLPTSSLGNITRAMIA
jgi:hypothetical protein